MSTRCVVTVIDPEKTFHVYRHHDGYPTTLSGVLATLPAALPLAWPLPRFEAMDFAAAIVAAWKRPGGGGIYLTGSYTDHGDLEFRYEVTQKDRILKVTTYEMTDMGWKRNGSRSLDGQVQSPPWLPDRRASTARS
jgi:hypothetical protein